MQACGNIDLCHFADFLDQLLRPVLCHDAYAILGIALSEIRFGSIDILSSLHTNVSLSVIRASSAGIDESSDGKNEIGEWCSRV